MNVRIFVDGKQVDREDIKNIELKQEGIKRILAEKMYRRKGESDSNKSFMNAS
ncbi:MAG: hypothetical protein NC548_59275 [Lachnospiraceae bacterium]|nr:hypothetical protein [Lachnospiraceae bacterium]